ncbi:MAG: CBS domain-containing protein [Planctomycetota bacterium]
MTTPSPKDIMTTDVIAVNPDTPILDAVELLAANNVSGLPVVDDNNTLIAILSETDVIDLIDADAEQRTVADYMTKPTIYFEVDEDLKDVCDFLKSSVFRRVPITENGKLAGIVSRRDVLEHILRLRGRTLAPAYPAKSI